MDPPKKKKKNPRGVTNAMSTLFNIPDKFIKYPGKKKNIN